MKIVEERTSPSLLILYRVLMAILLALILVLAGGTVYGLIFRGPSETSGDRSFSSAQGETAAGGEKVFTGMGRLRVPLGGLEPGTVILSIAFPYMEGDRPFSEELASKIKDLKEISTDYFSSLTMEELRETDESILKEELLARYNAVLRLGQIGILYFNDFQIIE
jgi:flagellar basal body-associated protein FliL